MNTKHLKLSVLLAVCLISSCTNEDMRIQSVNDQKPTNTNVLNIDEAKNLLEDFVADAFTKSKSSFEIKEHKTKTLYIDNTEVLPVSVKDTIPVYEFTTEMDGQKGYSIVVGDKRIEKVLISVPIGSLSDTSFIEPLRLYIQDIPMLIQQDLQQYYADIQEKAVQTKMTAETCYKFTSTTWGQGSPYNAKCPIRCGDNALAGCVAIAIAQVLAYHKVPSTLNWSAILASNKVTSSSSTTVKDQVSTLIAEIGTKINMQYECTLSSANTANAPSVLHSYGLNSGSLIPFSIIDCKYALENGGPTIMRGQQSGSTSGHAWVCDGWKRHIYDDATYYDYLSMNWGWDGSSNGFYLVENPISFSAGGHLFNDGFKIIHIYK